jgi:hypothetical protein
MRFYTNSHKHNCGIDLHARKMFLCILDAQGRVLLLRNMAAVPRFRVRGGIGPLSRLVVVFNDDVFVVVEVVGVSTEHGL